MRRAVAVAVAVAWRQLFLLSTYILADTNKPNIIRCFCYECLGT